jgi:hypothetical protein
MTMWMEAAIVATIFAVGNILFGHWEAETPKWRRLLKFVLILLLTLGISTSLGRRWAFLFLGILGLSGADRSCLVVAATRHQWLDRRAQGEVLRHAWMEISAAVTP